MSKPERSRHAALDQTWPAGVHHRHAHTPVHSVSTLRVKLIGACEAPLPRPGESKTRPYPSALDCNRHDDPWHDVSHLLDSPDHAYQPLAFARTMPAIPVEELELEDSGVRELRRLQLRLDPCDLPASAPRSPEPRAGTPTMRMRAQRRGALASAWRSWEQQPPGMAIVTATALCVLSALAVSLLAP